MTLVGNPKSGECSHKTGLSTAFLGPMWGRPSRFERDPILLALAFLISQHSHLSRPPPGPITVGCICPRWVQTRGGRDKCGPYRRSLCPACKNVTSTPFTAHLFCHTLAIHYPVFLFCS